MNISEAIPAKPRRKSDDFLSSRLYTSGQVMRLLRAGADMLGYPSEDHFGTELLLKALEAYPQIAELAHEQAAAAQRAREAWLARQPSIPGAGVASNASATGTI